MLCFCACVCVEIYQIMLTANPWIVKKPSLIVMNQIDFMLLYPLYLLDMQKSCDNCSALSHIRCKRCHKCSKKFYKPLDNVQTCIVKNPHKVWNSLKRKIYIRYVCIYVCMYVILQIEYALLSICFVFLLHTCLIQICSIFSKYIEHNALHEHQ